MLRQINGGSCLAWTIAHVTYGVGNFPGAFGAALLGTEYDDWSMRQDEFDSDTGVVTTRHKTTSSQADRSAPRRRR